ncbi:hypothetical protein FXF51_40325 [Nonomuraea sp. PA05]|uniref:hypothetical protein n=1 Tax=Nonomuraea sp. PA05 TaxID=2604466 RepID=UPI0011D871C7|nr:hypothetical protein [Nonomuraea sp. PA05]TYB57425.1 hypothetical protein FXF51_40325 [Nonomuraea sp. PA05]
MTERFEAGSEQWMSALREVVEETLKGVDVTGVQVAFYEEYLNPPAHLLAHGETTLTWHVEIGEKAVAIGPGRVADPTFWIEADYEGVLRLVRALSTDPALPEIVRDLETKGRLRSFGDRSKLPPRIAAALVTMHDEIAKRTK